MFQGLHQKKISPALWAFKHHHRLPYTYICHKHYTHVYKKLNTTQCASCKARPNCGTRFNRHSPDPEQVNHYLQTNKLSLCLVTSEDCICLNCYKLHLSIVNMEVRSIKNKLLELSNNLTCSKMGKAELYSCSNLLQSPGRALLKRTGSIAARH